MGSRSVTCYPKQVNQPHLNPARQPEGWKTELSYVEKFREHRQPTKSPNVIQSSTSMPYYADLISLTEEHSLKENPDDT